MCARILRRHKRKQRKEAETLLSPLRERARGAADAIHSDNSCRWFPVADVFPVYNYLYDYYHGRQEDARLRVLVQAAMARLNDLARRIEAGATETLPPEWEQAKAAVAQTSEVIDEITRPW